MSKQEDVFTVKDLKELLQNLPNDAPIVRPDFFFNGVKLDRSQFYLSAEPIPLVDLELEPVSAKHTKFARCLVVSVPYEISLD